jgi:protein transport protein SEC24
MREDIKLLGTDKEKSLYEPQEFFWRNIAKECSSDGIGVDMFLFPNAYIDVATIGTLASTTGGDTYCYVNFDNGRDGLKFAEDLKRAARRNYGYEALMKVRTSNGTLYFILILNSFVIDLFFISKKKRFESG